MTALLSKTATLSLMLMAAMPLISMGLAHLH